jgi:hypothetical protein
MWENARSSEGPFQVWWDVPTLKSDKQSAFLIDNKKGAIGLTLEIYNLRVLMSCWHISDKIYLSEHSYIQI